jgi:hypothetical protein
VFGAVYTGLGLILGFCVSLVGVFQAIFLGGSDTLGGAAAFGFLFGIGAILFMPIVYGVMGFLAGALSALIYNLVSKSVGGMELTLLEKPGLGPSSPPAMG